MKNVTGNRRRPGCDVLFLKALNSINREEIPLFTLAPSCVFASQNLQGNIIETNTAALQFKGHEKIVTGSNTEKRLDINIIYFYFNN